MVTMDELQGFNALWNKVPYYSDLEHWGMEDYWATPVETMSSNGGDCEDYSIAKYFSLRELGIPSQNLRITYVRSLKLNMPHMVLAYYPTPNADPYILDNLTGELAPASERTDRSRFTVLMMKICGRQGHHLLKVNPARYVCGVSC